MRFVPANRRSMALDEWWSGFQARNLWRESWWKGRTSNRWRVGPDVSPRRFVANWGKHKKQLRVYYCDHLEIPLPPGHKFPVRKYGLLREALESEGAFDLQPAPEIPIETIELAHDRDYVRAFLDGTLP